jgi:hypothetical protein
MGDILNFIQIASPIFASYGLTKSQLTPLILVAGLAAVLYWFFVHRSLKNTLNNFQEIAGDLHNAAREMQKYLRNKDKKWDILFELPQKPKWAQMNSPMVLNDDGKSLFTESGMEKIVRENQSSLVSKIEEQKPQTAYDVQNFAFVTLGDFLIAHEDLLKDVKSFLYNHPQFKGQSISMEDLVYVGMIRLRDLYIAKYPELIDTSFGE